MTVLDRHNNLNRHRPPIYISVMETTASTSEINDAPELSTPENAAATSTDAAGEKEKEKKVSLLLDCSFSPHCI